LVVALLYSQPTISILQPTTTWTMEVQLQVLFDL